MRISGIVSTICILAAAGLAVLLVEERQGRLKLEQANRALRQQMSRMGEATVEKQRLSNHLVQAASAPSRLKERLEAPSATDERYRELLRLRGEVGALRRQSTEIESLREDTRKVRAVGENSLGAQDASQAAKSGDGMSGNGSQLEILSAEYSTAHTNMDVAAELRERIRGDGLKAVASNNIKGDPEYGQVKHLTVVYRFGGVTRTNEFREGDVVILPGE